MKIKFVSDDKLPLNKMIEIPIMTIVVRAVFCENNKYYPEVFLGECLYKIQKYIYIYYVMINLRFLKKFLISIKGF